MHQLEFRLSAKQRILFLLVVGVFTPLALLKLATGDVVYAVVVLTITALFVVEFFVFGGFRLTLTPEGITHRGYRTTHYPWAQVRGIYPTNFSMTRRVLVQGTDGSSKRTLVPMHSWSQPDPEFDQKVATMQQWHAHFAGMPRQTPGAPMPGQPVPPQAYGPQQPVPPQPYGPQPYPQQPTAPPSAYGPPPGPPPPGPPPRH